MADLLFGLPCVRERRARIYRCNDGVLIYSNQKLRTRYRFGRASIEYDTNLIEADLRKKTNCYYALKPIDQVLIALQVHCFTGSPYRGRHIGNNHCAYSREIAFWDTNCRLARQYKLFLHHVLTVNLPSNRALNDVLNSSD